MLINVINLPEHTPTRRNRVEKDLQEEGCVYKIWNGLKQTNFVHTNISRSHKQIVRYAMQHRFKMVCICEDDVRFCDKGAWKYFLDNIPKDFDIYLSGIYWGDIKPDNTVTDFSGLHLYIVHERFYYAFLQGDENKDIDRSLAGMGKFVVCNPFAAIQYNGFSYHLGGVANYDDYLVGRQLFRAP
jgi:hypothetical protein